MFDGTPISRLCTNSEVEVKLLAKQRKEAAVGRIRDDSYTNFSSRFSRYRVNATQLNALSIRLDLFEATNSTLLRRTIQ